MEIKKLIRDIPDFPIKGVVFKDISPLLLNPEAMALCQQTWLLAIGDQKIDKVVGVESRGFFFAPMLAVALQAGFVPVRKPGKLPFATIETSYDLEYGSNVLQMHIDAIKPGDKVLIHDDVLATGGTIDAVIKLVQQLGGEVVHVNFLLELAFLQGKQKLLDIPYTSIVTY
ncbi:MAG: adenine phosphoribosyltransferase [Flavobacterium sp.]